MNKGKVMVLGGGVIGLCSAYYLKNRGFEVTILDKGDFSSGTSFGTVSYTHLTLPTIYSV